MCSRATAPHCQAVLCTWGRRCRQCFSCRTRRLSTTLRVGRAGGSSSTSRTVTCTSTEVPSGACVRAFARTSHLVWYCAKVVLVRPHQHVFLSTPTTTYPHIALHSFPVVMPISPLPHPSPTTVTPTHPTPHPTPHLPLSPPLTPPHTAPRHSQWQQGVSERWCGGAGSAQLPRQLLRRLLVLWQQCADRGGGVHGGVQRRRPVTPGRRG